MRRILLVLVVSAALLGALLLWHPWTRPVGGAADVDLIVLVSIDTLRRDRVGLYGRNEVTATPLTPRLDALGREGLKFEDARSPVPLTLPGHAVMLSGLPPAAIGIRVNAHGRLPPPGTRGYALLPEVLRAAGWRTGAFVSASPLLAGYGLDQGFETYDDEGLDATGTLAYPERPGEKTVDLALAWVAGLPAGDRAFLWVHLFEPHAPYAPWLDPSNPAELRYDADVARADRIVGRLLDGLEALGRGRSAVLVTADHGEALDELGETTHGLLLGDASLRVPFLLRVPGLSPDVRPEPVDLADVGPTLAGIAGAPWPGSDYQGPGRGVDLLATRPAADRVRVAESLYPRQRYGWAQLVGSVGPRGTLIDAGGDRVYWLGLAPLFEPQVAPAPATSDRVTDLGRLAEVLRAYRDHERSDRIRDGGQAAQGYGHGGPTEPFLSPEANGHLPDPYAVITRAAALDGLVQRLRAAGTSPDEKYLDTIRLPMGRMADADPGNPEIRFWLGRVWTQLATVARNEEGARTARRAAEEAYGAAWERGRRDAATLVLRVGVNAEGREAEMLDELRRDAATLPDDCRIDILEARLLRALGRHEEAEAACARAALSCRRSWEMHLLERARSEGSCR